MHVDALYQSHTDGAISLLLVTESQWQARDASMYTEDYSFLITQQFQGRLGDIGLIFNENGALARAYVGAAAGNDASAIAHSVLKLPPFAYACTTTLSLEASVQWALAQYRYDVYKKEAPLPRILCVPADMCFAIVTQASAIFLIRSLINTPANAMGPKELALVCAKLASEWGGVFEEWVGDDLLQANFPAIHAVGRASTNPPRLLRITWGDSTHPKLTLVGKGVCFDSGGLNIKPADGMRLMKKDMGGAAHVIGLAQWIMATALPVYLEVLIPAVENVIGPNAFKPGDVLTMRNGLTVEIDNTDAEGRLILADALAFAEEHAPELLIDFATLTGAARVAVGTDIAAMMTPDDVVARALTDAAECTNDPIWRLPLYAPYMTLLRSAIADMVNASASGYAGATTAALFLQRFIGTTPSWVHFDIMAWNLSDKPGKPEGGEAMAIRALMHYLQKKYL